MKKFFALMLAIVMTLSLAACGEQPQQQEEAKTKIDQIKEAGVLVLGTSADYPPAEFHTEIDGVDTIVGYDVALGQYIADSLGVKLEIVDMTFDALCIGLSKGDFDIVIAAMAATPERAEAVDFSIPYDNSDQVILVLDEDADAYNTTDDLKGKKIGYQSGTIQEGVLEGLDLLDNAVALGNAQNIVMELKAGKIDVAYIDHAPSLAFEAADDSLCAKDIGIVYESEGSAVAVQKGNEEFVEYINGVITEVLETGKFTEMKVEAQLLAGIE